MKRDYRLFLRDIMDACYHIQKFVEGADFEQFQDDEKTSSAVIRKLEIIGEAVKNIPDFIKEKYPQLDWKGMAGMRDRLTQILHTDEIDLFVMNKIPLAMQFEIIYSGQLICNNDNNERTDYEVLTCAKYWDFKRLEDEYDRNSLARLKEKYLKE